MTSRPRVLAEEPWPVMTELPLYQVPGWLDSLGLVAGITTRGDGFDLGWHSPDPTADFSDRWRRLVGGLGGFQEVVQGYQTHGIAVRWHDPAGYPGWFRFEGTDGHATAASGVLLTITVADCVPVYLALPDQGAFALVHAGWRGASAGIVKVAVEKLVEQTGRPASDIVMHCGVGICGNCYEVGPEVLEAFGLRGDFPGPWSVDLRDQLCRQADRMGLSNVTLSDRCTSCEPGLFFSHRGEQGKAGRMVAFLGRPGIAG